MLVMIFAGTAGKFRWICLRTTGDAVSNKFYQGPVGNFEGTHVMSVNFLDKNRTSRGFCCLIDPDRMFAFPKSCNIIRLAGSAGYLDSAVIDTVNGVL